MFYVVTLLRRSQIRIFRRQPPNIKLPMPRTYIIRVVTSGASTLDNVHTTCCEHEHDVIQSLTDVYTSDYGAESHTAPAPQASALGPAATCAPIRPYAALERVSAPIRAHHTASGHLLAASDHPTDTSTAAHALSRVGRRGRRTARYERRLDRRCRARSEEAAAGRRCSSR